jgi:histidinol dehydrogenase
MKILAFPSSSAQKRLKFILNRNLSFRSKDINTVKKILEDVRKNKDKALIAYTNRFDAPSLKTKQMAVSKREMSDAKSQVNRAFIKSLNKAIRHIESFHRHQVEQSWFTTNIDGSVLGQMVRPVGGAGVYVPGGKGGKTPLVSSLLMGCIPAKIAGVKRVCVTTPPMKNGHIDPHLLVAAQKVGIDAVFKAGSAWAIAALAYGTETIPAVDVIVGPGNIFVTMAKSLVAGTVGIDMVAGPSEILIIADESATPDYVAADMLSQAEHDPLASAILVTPSKDVAEKVSRALEKQLETLPRKALAEAALKDYGALMVVPDLETAFDVSNHIAPEHLELHVKKPFEYLGAVQNAGAVFLGPYTPEPVGDYLAGPNHVLPTAGTARFASALSVNHFVKKTSVVYYGKKAFERDRKDIIRLAEIEGLIAHGRAVNIRK